MISIVNWGNCGDLGFDHFAVGYGKYTLEYSH